MRPTKCNGCEYLRSKIKPTGFCGVKAYLHCASFGKAIKDIKECRYGPYHDHAKYIESAYDKTLFGVVPDKPWPKPDAKYNEPN